MLGDQALPVVPLTFLADVVRRAGPYREYFGWRTVAERVAACARPELEGR